MLLFSRNILYITRYRQKFDNDLAVKIALKTILLRETKTNRCFIDFEHLRHNLSPKL